MAFWNEATILTGLAFLALASLLLGCRCTLPIPPEPFETEALFDDAGNVKPGLSEHIAACEAACEEGDDECVDECRQEFVTTCVASSGMTEERCTETYDAAREERRRRR